MIRFRLALVLVLLSAAQAVTAVRAAAAEGPVPPCADEVVPAPGGVVASPVVRVWRQGDLPAAWVPPACVGWTVPGLRAMVAISGRLDAAQAALVAERLAAVSHFAGIRFWASNSRAWEVLIREAHALDAADPPRPRADYTAADLISGQALNYSEADNGSGENRYLMRVLVHTPGRLVVTTRNVGTIRFLLLPLFHPGDLEVLFDLEQQTDGSWLFYSLARIGAGASVLVNGHAESLVNRASAMYGYLSGVLTDRDPLAAR